MVEIRWFRFVTKFTSVFLRKNLQILRMGSNFLAKFDQQIFLVHQLDLKKGIYVCWLVKFSLFPYQIAESFNFLLFSVFKLFWYLYDLLPDFFRLYIYSFRALFVYIYCCGIISGLFCQRQIFVLQQFSVNFRQ